MKFTWDDFFEISQGQKPSNFKPPDWEKVKTVISEKLEICNDEKLQARVVELAIRYGKFVKSKNAKCSSKRLTACRDIVVDSEDFSSSSAENPSKKQRKSLDQSDCSDWLGILRNSHVSYLVRSPFTNKS